MGRKLQCVSDKAETMLLKFHKYLESKEETRPILNIEKQNGSHLGLITDYLSNKYRIEEEVSVENVIAKQRQNRMERIKSKVMHGILFDDPDETYNWQQSSAKTRKHITTGRRNILQSTRSKNILREWK